jgi:hypothetical protein
MTQLQTGKYPLPWQLSVSKCDTNKILSRERLPNCGSRTDAASLDNLLSAINKTERIRPVTTLGSLSEGPSVKITGWEFGVTFGVQGNHEIIMWRIWPLLDNSSVNTFPRLRSQQWDLRCWIAGRYARFVATDKTQIITEQYTNYWRWWSIFGVSIALGNTWNPSYYPGKPKLWRTKYL